MARKIKESGSRKRGGGGERQHDKIGEVVE